MGDEETHRSTLAEHPDIQGVLPRFVARLPGHVKRLRGFQEAGDAPGLLQLVHQLRGTGKSYGFAPLSTYAGEAEDLLLAGRTAAEAAPTVERLVAYIEHIEGYTPA